MWYIYIYSGICMMKKKQHNIVGSNFYGILGYLSDYPGKPHPYSILHHFTCTDQTLAMWIQHTIQHWDISSLKAPHDHLKSNHSTYSYINNMIVSIEVFIKRYLQGFLCHFLACKKGPGMCHFWTTHDPPQKSWNDFPFTPVILYNVVE